jgi:large subunit ribosomal protein L32
MGAICPKGKQSRSRTGKRRAQSWKIPIANLIPCSKCGELVRSHYMCKACGSYAKREIIAQDA